jgi:cullin 4
MMNKGMKNDSGGPKKKMVIKPFSSKPKVPEDFEMSSWKLLENAVEAVCTNTAIDTSKEVLYRTVEDLCLHKFSVSIYDKLREKCKVHINTKVDSLSQQVLYKPSNVVIVLTVNQSTHPNFLEVVDRVWKEHCEHMLTIRNIFLFLDQ